MATFVLSALVGQRAYPEWPAYDLPAYVLAAVVSFPLAVRRRAPVTVLIITSAGYAVYLAGGYQPSFNFWGPILAFYTVAGLRSSKVTTACAIPLGLLMMWSGFADELLSPWVSIGQGVVVPAFAWAFGENVRKLHIATALLRAEQRQRARLAVMEERTRMARELHDVVAHHMSVISVQAGLAGYVFTSDPPTARTALDTIGDTSREALAELRRLLSVLRPSEVDESFDPAPGLDDLAELAGRAGADLEITGTPRPLPSGLELCAYRVIQEALTNAMKHAQPARAKVFVDYQATSLMVRVISDGPVVNRKVEASGHGLIGMRERARLYRGTVHAGYRPEGGFEVELTLPIGERT
ncbi:sensor histidine kinase [Actinocrispum sp. NPDC049592]|uniref:sensor histidine kinase n=1 Tax=Actinocrispum sp. NPDC049592 TaxID=3154835 RepID=UPI0034273486